MDAILLHCEKTGLEIELIPKLINNHIKNKIKIEGEELNFLPKSKSKRLPI